MRFTFQEWKNSCDTVEINCAAESWISRVAVMTVESRCSMPSPLTYGRKSSRKVYEPLSYLGKAPNTPSSSSTTASHMRAKAAASSGVPLWCSEMRNCSPLEIHSAESCALSSTELSMKRSRKGTVQVPSSCGRSWVATFHLEP